VTQEREWRAGIAEHGWLVVDVPSDDLRPGFQFTAGLTERGLPELIVYGLGSEVGMHALNDVARRLVDGKRFADGDVVHDVLEGEYRTQLWDATWLQDRLGAAFTLYGEDDVRVRQLVVPDLDDRLPWEDGYAHPELQPVLFEQPSGDGPRRAGPDEAADEHPVPAGWDLPQDPHLGVLVTGFVGSGELPVLSAVRSEEEEWQFVDGVHDPDVETAHVLCLHHVVEQDPSLREVLRRLPSDYVATRDAVGSDWQFEPDVED
jgi:hypothetical protein